MDLAQVSLEKAPGGYASEFDEAYDDAPKEERFDALAAAFKEPLGSVARRPLLVVSTGATVAEAVRAMNDRHVGCALVVKEGRLAGIFTERDVLTKVVGKSLDPATVSVESVMTPDPDTLPASARVAFALQRMSVEGYRHVPIVDDEQRPVGVVAVRDIVAWICELFPKRILNLPPEPGYPKSVDGG